MFNSVKVVIGESKFWHAIDVQPEDIEPSGYCIGFYFNFVNFFWFKLFCWFFFFYSSTKPR